jgi:tagatose 1,6-diphosphate aldolase
MQTTIHRDDVFLNNRSMVSLPRKQDHWGPLQDDDLLLQFTSLTSHPVHKVPTYYFRMLHASSGETLGEINLRIGSNRHIELYAGHIGFSVVPAYRGHRYASRALLLLLPLARLCHLDTLWITCDPSNVASRRTCECAGAKLIEIVDVPKTCIINRTGHPQKCRYRLDIR